MTPQLDTAMQCPTCTITNLLMTVREGVEIDYCPQCRGVWLDRGELDKLIDRAASPPPSSRAEPTHQAPQRELQQSRTPGFVDSDYPGNRGYPNRRKKSWLSDIFD